MKLDILEINSERIPCVTLNTVIVGTGAAGFNTALRLSKLGQNDIAVITDGICRGTSRNTGSDKQTYYKLDICGDSGDSPRAMAEDLFRGKCVDGDHAYIEAALSVQCFMQLSELGVPFPVNRFGEYVGYKTDHDPRARATSAGPLTSKLMTETLEREVLSRNITIFDNLLAVSLLCDDKTGENTGLFAYNLAYDPNAEMLFDNDKKRFTSRYVLFNTANTVLATGGPAGIYANTVYPLGHTGSSSLALRAGAGGKNLTEWQYGLASVSPRWNVSGTYMQVFPRFVSIDKNGVEREFLNEYYSDPAKCLSIIFRKGYEWPFDSKKAKIGSSVIDLLVFRETVLRGRRVYLDYRKNPMNFSELPYEQLDSEACDYIKKAEACFGNPIDRLIHMNRPAYELYLSKGVDLKHEMLEISLCAQHNNGGIDVDMWWQTDIHGLFAVGELAGTHGVYRPGGSALNSGQVGSMRAAQYIAFRRNSAPKALIAEKIITENQKLIALLTDNAGQPGFVAPSYLSKIFAEKMSEAGGAIRSIEKIETLLYELCGFDKCLRETVCISSYEDISDLYKLIDTVFTQRAYLSAMRDYLLAGGKSRGSSIFLLTDADPDDFDDYFSYDIDGGELDSKVEITKYNAENNTFESIFREVRPLPDGGGFFENIWRSYRENRNIY